MNTKTHANVKPDRVRQTPSPGDEVVVNDALETFGEAVPGLIFESIIDPDRPNHLVLHSWDGRRTATRSEVEHDGVHFVCRNLDSGLVQSVRFAPASERFISPTKLIGSVRNFLSTYVRLQPEVADLLVAFVIASWFCDAMPVAPVLFLFGPDSTVSQVLRLLGCLCRRPILLGDVDFEGIATLPVGLHATLLINQRHLGARMKRALVASKRRHFCVVRGGRRLDLYGAKAFACEDSNGEEHGLRAWVSPAQKPMPFLTDLEERVIAQDFQARLLRYRMVHYERVRQNRVDCSAFVPEMREEASGWLAPILDCSELSNSVREEISRQSRETSWNRFFDPKCLIAEAALSFCHKQNATHFFIGELTDNVNGLLAGRHEEASLTPKRVGSILRELGVYGERVAQGYKVTLADTVRDRLHRIAWDYQVLSLEDGVNRCEYCRHDEARRESTQ